MGGKLRGEKDEEAQGPRERGSQLNGKGRGSDTPEGKN